MNIRSYEESDLVAAVELFTSSVRDLTTRHYDEGQRAAWAPATPDLSAWKERLSTLQTVIAEQGRVLAGFIAYRQDGYIDLLYTSPDFPRQGIASALYREAETALAATGTRELSVHASLTALPFFEHQGFQIQEEQHVLRSGVSFRRFAMRKLLA